MRRKKAPSLREPWRGVVPCKRTLEARSIDDVTRAEIGTREPLLPSAPSVDRDQSACAG